jgi:hypothetical protein
VGGGGGNVAVAQKNVQFGGLCLQTKAHRRNHHGDRGDRSPNFWDPGTSNVLVPQLFGLSHFFPLIFLLCIKIKKLIRSFLRHI